MSKLARLYLRASTDEQDANRAQERMLAFAREKGLTIVGTYPENESGTKLDRPELRRLLKDANPGDILLVEQIDRLTRLTAAEWDKLNASIQARGILIVTPEIPELGDLAGNELFARMGGHIMKIMLDLLALLARKDYDDRRRRQFEGQSKARAEGKYKGRPPNTARNDGVIRMLTAGMSWAEVMATTGCSRSTVAKASAKLRKARLEAAA